MSDDELVLLLRSVVFKLNSAKKDLSVYCQHTGNPYASQDVVSPLQVAIGKVLKEIELLDQEEEEYE